MIEFILFSIYYIPFKIYLLILPLIFGVYTLVNYKNMGFRQLKLPLILITYLFFAFILRSFNLPVYITGVYFYFFPLLFFSLFYKISNRKIEKIILFNAYLVLSQIPFVLYQFIVKVSTSGFNLGAIAHDWAVGSIKLFSHAGSHEPGVMMMMNFIFYLNLYMIYKKKIFKHTAGFAFIFWILTSTTHSYLAFIEGTFIFIFSQKFIFIAKKIFPYFIAVIALHFTLVYTQYNDYMTFFNLFHSENIEKYGKFQLLNNTVDLIKENPSVILVGTGIGEYNSRTAAITTSDYLSPKLKNLYNKDRSFFIKKYLSNITQSIAGKFQNKEYATIFNYESIINKPYSSIISVFIEFGLIGTILLFLFILTIYKSLKRNNSYIPKVYFMLRFESTLFILGALFVMDGWMEYPKFMGLYVILLGSFIKIGNSFKEKKILENNE